MRELAAFTVLSGEPLTSPSGRYVLDYEGDDLSWTAVLTDTETGDVLWRAGRPGWLYLGALGALQTAEWTSEVAAVGAVSLTISDEGGFRLWDDTGSCRYDSCVGVIRPVELHDAAPAAAITRDTCLVHGGKQRRVVTRNRDGSLQVTTHQPSGARWSSEIPSPVARWLEQDGTALTWRVLPMTGTRRQRMLCLVDADDHVLWCEHMRGVSALPPAAVPHAYGGATLEHGGRLRHQSLTSPSGAHTLVHQDDGNLVLYCNASHEAVWATHTWWSGDGWVDFADGDLVLRNACGADIWRAGTTTAWRLTVADYATLTLADAEGVPVWELTGHECVATVPDTAARGSVLRRGQTLHRQSLTAPEGGTVFVHGDHRLVLFAEDGTWLWEKYLPGDRPTAEALRRLGAGGVALGTWQELLDQVAEADLDVEDMIAAAFPIGRNALIVEDNGWLGRETPGISVGTFAVSCSVNVNGLAYFRVFRDGAVVADLGENGDSELTVPEVISALAEMGIPGCSYPPSGRYPELLCRIAGVRPTVADVTGVGYIVSTTAD